MLIVSNLSKEYNGIKIFESVNFYIGNDEKIGLVGKNGAGKTTLCNIIAGKDKEYSGKITVDNPEIKIGYFRQLYKDYDKKVLNKTVFDYVLETQKEVLELEKEYYKLLHKISVTQSKSLLDRFGAIQEKYEKLEGYTLLDRVQEVLNSLGIHKDANGLRKISWYSKMADLSGGERKIVELATILLDKSINFLILDEPTNHLDLLARKWLEDFIKNFKGTVLIVSHDRYLLSKSVDRILDIHGGRLYDYKANYSKYVVLKNNDFKALLHKYRVQQKELKRLEESLERLRQRVLAGGGSATVNLYHAMETRVAKFKAKCIPDPRLDYKTIKFPDWQNIGYTGRIVVRIRNFSFAYESNKGKRVIYKNLNLLVEKGNKVALLGHNGVGKTTLFKVILTKYCLDRSINPSEFGITQFYNKYSQYINDADIFIGPSVKIAYYSQKHDNLPENITIRQFLHNQGITNERQLQGILRLFLFTSLSAEKRKIGFLSGGEKSRLQFIKLIHDNPTFLLLDEPINHLDIPSIELVENSLAQFPGSLMVISHDRFFLDKIINHVAIVNNQTLIMEQGTYTSNRSKLEKIFKIN